MDREESTTGIVASGVLSGGSRPDEWQRRIRQRCEQLYRARMVQRLLLTWAWPGNLLLIAIAATSIALAPSHWLMALVAAVPVGSVAASARLVYRQHFRVRAFDTELREMQRAQREDELAELGADVLAVHKRYRARVPDVVAEYRSEARKHRRKYTALQAVIITGSIIASTLSAASVSIVEMRWLAVGVSLLVAVAAAYSGFAKYRERGVSLQQAADGLEREYESVEMRVGRYRRFGDEREAYAEFANEVEALRDEQAKRQLQLGHEATLSLSAL